MQTETTLAVQMAVRRAVGLWMAAVPEGSREPSHYRELAAVFAVVARDLERLAVCEEGLRALSSGPVSGDRLAELLAGLHDLEPDGLVVELGGRAE